MTAKAQDLHGQISRLLNASQDSSAAHAKLIARTQKLFKDSTFEEFFDQFTLTMQGLMINMQKNPNVDRIIDFIAKFATSLTAKGPENLDATTIKQDKENVSRSSPNKTATNEKTISDSLTLLEKSHDEIENPFLNGLIDYLIENHKSNSDAVRYRCCQFLSKLMALISDQFVDEDLFDRLCDAMLERLKDINSRVQVQAIAAIYRLQDPNDRDCRVIRALLFLMTYDPHWQVRYQALSHVAFSRITLPDIIDRVRDPHPSVRRKALLILSEKVLIKFISIEKRLFILNYSLKDDDKAVLDTCCKKLLPSWLAFKENDLCKLLKALDVVEATETAELMLSKMFADESMERLYSDFSVLLNDKHVIPLEKLDAESALYWAWICQKSKSIADSEDDQKAPMGESESLALKSAAVADSEDFLDRLLPSLTEFCEYVTEVVKKFERERAEKELDARLQLENSFILKQLIKLFSYIDFSDVHGKKTLINLCHELFSNKNYSYLFENIMSVYKLILPNLQQRLNNMAELISDLGDPTCSQPSATAADENNKADQTSENVTASTSADGSGAAAKKTPQEIVLKISELKFQRFKLKDDFDNLYREAKNIDKSVDMNKLSDLRNEIKNVEDQIAELQAQMNGDNSSRQQSMSATGNESVAAAASTAAPVVEQAPFDPVESAYHCLQLALCLLQDVEVKSLSPHLRSIFDTLILPNIGSVHEELRKLAVRALNLVCILKLEVAQKYVPLLLEIIQRDKKDVVMEAFKAMINCIMAYSMNKLINGCLDSSGHQQAEVDPEALAEATSRILSVMTSLLDHEDSDIYTVAVEGFCKLYMTGHILSAKLFSKLLIMYYSPLTQNDTKLRACLSSFLPQFSFLRASNQLCVEEAFMPTLKCLMNAPTDSYISEIDLTKVVETLFHLTNPKNLMRKGPNQRQVQNTNICHENIAKSICYEILKDDNAFKCKTYLKIVQLADLSQADYYSLKDIYGLAVDITEHIQDKILKKTAQRFAESVLELMTKMPQHQEEERRRRREEQEMSAAKVNETTTTNAGEATRAMSEAGDVNDTLSTSSTELIDLEFKKLNSMTGIGKLIKKSSSANLTTASNVSIAPSQQGAAKASLLPKAVEEDEKAESGDDEEASEEREEEVTVVEQEPAAKPAKKPVGRPKASVTAKTALKKASAADTTEIEEALRSPRRKQQKMSMSPVAKGRTTRGKAQQESEEEEEEKEEDSVLKQRSQSTRGAKAAGRKSLEASPRGKRASSLRAGPKSAELSDSRNAKRPIAQKGEKPIHKAMSVNALFEGPRRPGRPPAKQRSSSQESIEPPAKMARSSSRRRSTTKAAPPAASKESSDEEEEEDESPTRATRSGAKQTTPRGKQAAAAAVSIVADTDPSSSEEEEPEESPNRSRRARTRSGANESLTGGRGGVKKPPVSKSQPPVPANQRKPMPAVDKKTTLPTRSSSLRRSTRDSLQGRKSK